MFLLFLQNNDIFLSILLILYKIEDKQNIKYIVDDFHYPYFYQDFLPKF